MQIAVDFPIYLSHMRAYTNVMFLPPPNSYARPHIASCCHGFFLSFLFFSMGVQVVALFVCSMHERKLMSVPKDSN